MSIFSREKQRSKIKIDNRTNKTFNYTKGNTSLGFTLRTDIKTELEDFLELLKIATDEVEEEVKKEIVK